MLTFQELLDDVTERSTLLSSIETFVEGIVEKLTAANLSKDHGTIGTVISEIKDNVLPIAEAVIANTNGAYPSAGMPAKTEEAEAPAPKPTT